MISPKNGTTTTLEEASEGERGEEEGEEDDDEDDDLRVIRFAISSRYRRKWRAGEHSSDSNSNFLLEALLRPF